MNLYDHIIAETKEVFSPFVPKIYPYDVTACWKDNGSSKLIMLRDSAYELGGGVSSVNYTCVTTTPDIIKDDAIYVYGDDLGSIRKNVSFVRIALLEVDDLGEDDEKVYNAIREMEFVRYHVFPDGYMIRVSSSSNQEQVRISKRALKKGISFRRIGSNYIQKYKEIPGVRHVNVIFATECPVISKLIGHSGKVDAITKTLTHILDGIPADCGHCSMKAVCDEVEGMKELHMGRKIKRGM